MKEVFWPAGPSYSGVSMAELSDIPAPPETGSPGLDLFMTVIRVANWSTIVRWYTETLGLTPLLLDNEHEFALFSAGTGRLGIQGTREPRPSSARGMVRLVFQVANLDRQREALLARGVAVSEPLENQAEGYREVRLQDPEGNSLRLFSWRDPSHGQKFAIGRPRDA
jgi:predicted enzyme related to lactoylglutathione lyase